jgi:hypothetical protein
MKRLSILTLGVQDNVDASEVFTNALVDEINRFDQQAVIRQAREYR